jgi:tripartite-type tricarboxylate transporter receptor subunit TctC
MNLARTAGAALIGAIVLAPSPAPAQEFPERPITVVIPLGAGGSHDLHARGITSIMGDILGQPMVVKLVPGGAGMKGTAEVASADADGYTIIFTHNAFDQIVPQTRDVGFDPLDSFVSVAKINQAEPILCAPSDRPFNSIDEFVAHAKERPGELNMGHSGVWGAGHIPTMQLLNSTGVEANLIPHEGGGPTLQGLLAGEDDLSFIFTTQARPHVLAGTIKCLAVAGDTRLEGDPDFADLPSMSELGHADVSFTMERIFMAPRGVPADRLTKLRDAFKALTENKSFSAFIKSIGERVIFESGDEYEQKRERRLVEYKDLIAKVAGGGQ